MREEYLTPQFLFGQKEDHLYFEVLFKLKGLTYITQRVPQQKNIDKTQTFTEVSWNFTQSIVWRGTLPD